MWKEIMIDMMRSEKKASIKELLGKEQVFAPCVWDPISARAAELSGFKAMLLGGAPVASEIHGTPDLGIITADDLVRQTEYICDSTKLPLLIDADDGYGESPINTYRLTRRLILAGAQGFSIEDTSGIRGYMRWGRFRSMGRDGSVKHELVSRKMWLSKIAAAVEACEGTNAIVIARTEAKIGYGMKEAIERANAAREVGAHMILLMGMMNQTEAELVAREVPGWKMWPDVSTVNGVPDVLLSDIEPLGFNLVTSHIFEPGYISTLYNVGAQFNKDHCIKHEQAFANEQALTGFAEPWMEKETDWINIGAAHDYSR